ncbi:hypothetical protein MMC13_004130 [Lambiella insularis]|nr:hypothetical protein [Lambiella insularis]
MAAIAGRLAVNPVGVGVHEEVSANHKHILEDVNSADFTVLRAALPPNGLDTSIESDRGELERNEAECDGRDFPEEDVHSVMGFSIGRQQTRLVSPTTPAAEKFAAMKGLNEWHFHEDTVSEEREPGLRTLMRHPLRNGDIDSSVSSKEPSPRQAQFSLPKIFGKTDNEANRSKGSPETRSRASTGPTSMLADLNIKRFWTNFSIPSISDQSFFKDISLPSMPKMSSNTNGDKEMQAGPHNSTRSGRSSSVFMPKFSWTGSQRSREPSPSPELGSKSTGPRERRERSTSRPAPLQLQFSDDSAVNSRDVSEHQATIMQQSGGRRLRKATSEQSLTLRSALSRVSSLGDDSRWDHIHGQVNSRMKAIKDSLQDSALKLPSLPNINFSALRPDFGHKRAASGSNVSSGIDSSYIQESKARDGKASTQAPNPRPPQKPSEPPHHHLHTALDDLTGDVVVLGGYRGSVLRSAEPPHRQLWVPVKVGLNIRKVNLEVGLDPQDEENMEERIFSSGMLSHIGPVDISRRLLKRLRHCKNARAGKLRVHDYGYDWRLSPHLLSQKLADFMGRLRCNQPGVPAHERGATVIAHSLGGLITRHVVNKQPDLFAGILYAGVPQRCVNILGPFRNGDEVLLSSRVLTAQVNFTLRTSFVLLPEDGQCFLDKYTNEQYHVNFFDVEAWKEYAFSPCIAPAQPSLSLPERRGLLGSVSGQFPSLGSRKSSATMTPPTHPVSSAADVAAMSVENTANPQKMQMGARQLQVLCTIPLPAALAYLRRTLAETLAFKNELAFDRDHASSNSYPPVAVLYGTSVPTVYGARVAGRDGIKRADAYDDLAFASGDGVVLARAAMLPRGYSVAEGGKVRSERGHVGLLGDLDAVGKCLLAIGKARRRGVGMGLEESEAECAS